MRSRLLRLAILPVLASLPSTSVQAQSVVAGSVEGVVRSTDGSTVGDASVTLRPLGLGLERTRSASRTGDMAFHLVSPGAYELFVEALGYRPVLLRPLDVPVGDRVFVEIELTPETGVVQAVDTVALGGSARPRWTAGGVSVGSEVIEATPDRERDLVGLASLVSSVDPALGMQGLPGSMTSVFIDGVPFTPARHPGFQGEGSWSPLLSRPMVSAVQALPTPGDVEWLGGGSVLSVSSRSGTSSVDPTALSGAWSGNPLWNSGEHGFEAPGFNSAWASGRTGLELVPDTASLFLAADGMRLLTPRPPGLTATELGSLGGVDETLAATLAAPSLEETTRASALTSLDWWFSPVQRFSLRGAVGRLERTRETLGAPYLGYGRTPVETATDFSVVGDLTVQQSDAITLEVRGALSGSAREFEGGMPPRALVAEPGLVFGAAPGSAGESTRLDFSFSSAAHYRFEGGGVLKGGGQVRATRHRILHSPLSGGRYLFGEASDVPGGLAIASVSESPEGTFSAADAGLFAQYIWTPSPGLRFSVGARVDYQTVPSEADANTDLLAATGLDNTDHPDRFIAPGFAASATWDLTGGAGRAVFVAAGALQTGNLDPALLYEAFVNDGSCRIRRFVGTEAGWPDAGLPGSATETTPITVFGPDTRPPRHARFSGGLLARLQESTSLYLGGSFRRTDFLPRRRDLNLGLLGTGTDQFGRALRGQLRKDGALVSASGDTHRRFEGYDAIWALDPDGSSTWAAGTVGLDHRGEELELSVSYTRSVTEDDWHGAAAADPEAELRPGVSDTLGTWAEGTSDFDIPHRLVATARVGAGPLSLSGVYRWTSALPFTPGYRRGVDANGDGSGSNDPAFVPSAAELGSLASEWPCLRDMAGAFAERNGCRGEAQHSLDARLQLRLATVGGRNLHLVVDGLNLVEGTDGLRDTALLLVDPDSPLSTSSDGSRTTVPVTVNPDFGRVLVPFSPGRILRIGLSLGGR